MTEAWRDWFPDQTCRGCDEQHPGQDCTLQQDLFTEQKETK